MKVLAETWALKEGSMMCALRIVELNSKTGWLMRDRVGTSLWLELVLVNCRLDGKMRSY